VDNNILYDAACVVMLSDAKKEERRQGKMRSEILYQEELKG
jgi:hypothetical protein